MKHLSVLLVSLFTLASCSTQTKYFRPTGIIDRTKEFSGKNLWIHLNNQERSDGYTRIGDSIFGGEIDCNVEPLKNIDTKTFKVLAGTKYARDTNHAYYPLGITCIDYTDCGVCQYWRVIIEGANPATFQYLGKDYATDGKLVFFRGEKVEGADGPTFKVIEGPQYLYFAVDKSHVYKFNQIFQDADPATFYYAKLDSRNKISEFDCRYIIGDKNNKWEYIPSGQIKKIEKK